MLTDLQITKELKDCLENIREGDTLEKVLLLSEMLVHYPTPDKKTIEHIAELQRMLVILTERVPARI